MSPSISRKKLDANRRNALKSTGPRTPEGKARSARNAVTHGLFCKHLLLPGEKKRVFRDMRNDFLASLNPQDIAELMLVERIVIASWKLCRLQRAEAYFHWDAENQMLRMDGLQERIDQRYKDNPHKDHPRKPDDLRPLPAAITLAAQLDADEDAGRFERTARHEQRLENSIYRAMRELRQLRKDRKNADPLPRTPFLGEEFPDEGHPERSAGEGRHPEQSAGQGRHPERSAGFRRHPERSASEVKDLGSRASSPRRDSSRRTAQNDDCTKPLNAQIEPTSGRTKGRDEPKTGREFAPAHLSGPASDTTTQLGSASSKMKNEPKPNRDGALRQRSGSASDAVAAPPDLALPKMKNEPNESPEIALRQRSGSASDAAAARPISASSKMKNEPNERPKFAFRELKKASDKRRPTVGREGSEGLARAADGAADAIMGTWRGGSVPPTEMR
jgi:hypothetical protein